MKTSDLEGAALEYWMFQAMDRNDYEGIPFEYFVEGWDSPMLGWAEIGPLIERERIILEPPTPSSSGLRRKNWTAGVLKYYDYDGPDCDHMIEGPTALVAVMRCLISHKFGKELQG